MTIEQLAQSMLELQSYGCSNINFVTPTHVIPAITAAVELAKKDGLTLPIVYNTGGYDLVETLKLLDGFVDIYMPDMKYSDSKVAEELSAAPDYPQVNREAVKEMHRQVGDLEVRNGLATRGLLVRHLVLPDKLAGSFEIIDFLAEQISKKTTINVMDQYRPCYKASSHPKINRRPTFEEIELSQTVGNKLFDVDWKATLKERKIKYPKATWGKMTGDYFPFPSRTYVWFASLFAKYHVSGCFRGVYSHVAIQLDTTDDVDLPFKLLCHVGIPQVITTTDSSLVLLGFY